MEQSQESSRRRLILAGVVLIVGIVCLLGLVELLLWTVGVESIAERRRALAEAKAACRSTLTRSDTLGWELRPTAPDAMKGAASGIPLLNRINSLGFRGDEFPWKKPCDP